VVLKLSEAEARQLELISSGADRAVPFRGEERRQLTPHVRTPYMAYHKGPISLIL